MPHTMNFSRDAARLSTAMNIALGGLCSTSDLEDTLSASFENAVAGLGAQCAALFLIKRRPTSIRLHALCKSGFSEQQLSMAACGEEVEGSNLSALWKIVLQYSVVRSEPNSVCNGEEKTHKLETPPHVLIVPVQDAVLETMMAVLYFQADPAATTFGPTEKMWAENYALAVSHILARGMGQERQSQEKTNNVSVVIERPANAPEIIGESPCTMALRQDLHETIIPASDARDPDPILILGEKGTGKDLIARYIYAYSRRRKYPFVAVNCAEITDELATARFFGHKKGSFTGSMGDEPGFFRAADQGILFLDEIAELSLRAQGTLLRVLENRTVVPLGETKEFRVDVQVILATNHDLDKAVAAGTIRADLCDRFKTQAIRLVPLRERPWDIPALVQHFIAYHEKRTQKKSMDIDLDALKLMVAYSWPGNVRELARVCSLLVTHTKEGAPIDRKAVSRYIPEIINSHCSPKAGPMLVGDDIPMRDALKEFGREIILARLRKHNWNFRSARESLGLPKTTFFRYTRGLGIPLSEKPATAAYESKRGHMAWAAQAD